MPVVLRFKGYTFFFFSNEGNPREPLPFMCENQVRARNFGLNRKFVYRKATG